MLDPPQVASEVDVLQAFRFIDALLAAGPRRESLLALRDRLAGELLGDGDRVASTLADEFELTTVAGGSSTTTDRGALIASIGRQGDGDGEGDGDGAAMIWMELEDLVVEESAIAGRGMLRMLGSTPGEPTSGQRAVDLVSSHLTSIPLAFFLRFDGALMTSEVIFMAGPLPESTVLRKELPSIERLRALFTQQ